MKRLALTVALLLGLYGSANAQVSSQVKHGVRIVSVQSVATDTTTYETMYPEPVDTAQYLFRAMTKYKDADIPDCDLTVEKDKDPALDRVEEVRRKVDNYEHVVWAKGTLVCDDGAFIEYVRSQEEGG